jgi:hypothetical protein
MKHLTLAAIATLAAATATAQESRELGSHEHGVGQLDIAFEGDRIAMELRAPGADIVGFEHAAESAEDRAALDAAVARLAGPLDLFRLPEAAGCAVLRASAQLVQDVHDHEEGHDDGDDHGDEHGDDHDHDHDEAAEDHDAAHTEFSAEYLLTCADPAAIARIDFGYFEAFPNARELEVQLISDRGARGFEVERSAPFLDLAGLI